MRRSIEVDSILSAATEMAREADQPATTGHVLLGMLTSQSRAAALLGDLGADAERILEALGVVKRRGGLHEPEDLLERLGERMFEVARRTDAPLASSLHLLLALTREKRSVAFQVFRELGLAPHELRTLALSRITGPMPRSLRQPDRSRGSAFRDEPDRPVAVADDEGPAGDERPAARSAPPPPPEPEKAPSGEAAWSESDASPGRPDVDPASARQAAATQARAAESGSSDRRSPFAGDGEAGEAEGSEGSDEEAITGFELVQAMIDILNKRQSNNPCLVGEPGVGKTAVVQGLARALLDPERQAHHLRDRILISLDVGALVAGTELRGAFSRRMAQLKDEVRSAGGRIVVFIDELHTLVGAGASEGAPDAAHDLKASLARGEFPCIGATTPREYHRHIEQDPALERRFQPLEVPEPAEEDAERILDGLAPRYEAHHGVVYLPEARRAAVHLGRRYIFERRLPDKAVDLLDTAGARAVRQRKETVEQRDVAEVVSEATQIPLERLLADDAERMLAIRDFLGQRLVGHDGILDTIAEVIQRNSAGFGSERPIGSFLFLGPTGVGKTETAKVLADFLFCSRDALTRFDMSEYMERHAVSRLLGAAPGYVGHEDPGALTAALTRRPYQVLLFDEIEKAHPDVLNLLLQILDEGRITDAKGQTLSFSHTVVVLTSNLGSEQLEAQRRQRIGFGGDGGPTSVGDADLERLRDAASRALPPELWGRIEEKCVFAPLDREQVADVARLLVRESSAGLAAERGIDYEVADEVVELLIDQGGWEPSQGARPMRRAVQRLCEGAVARAVLRGEAAPGDRLRLERDGDGVRVVRLGGEAAPDAEADSPREQTG